MLSERMTVGSIHSGPLLLIIETDCLSSKRSKNSSGHYNLEKAARKAGKRDKKYEERTKKEGMKKTS